LEAAKHHIYAASRHLAAAGKHHDGEHEEAKRHSGEAEILSKVADGKSKQAHHWSTAVARKKV
jgi:hypothetical protein